LIWENIEGEIKGKTSVGSGVMGARWHGDNVLIGRGARDFGGL
jgi:hypothetical protein